MVQGGLGAEIYRGGETHDHSRGADRSGWRRCRNGKAVIGNEGSGEHIHPGKRQRRVDGYTVCNQQPEGNPGIGGKPVSEICGWCAFYKGRQKTHQDAAGEKRQV